MRYPGIHVRLIGEDGNAFAILGRVRAAMRAANVPPHQIAAFTHEAMAARSYWSLLVVCLEWVNCDGEKLVGADQDPDGGGGLAA